MLKLHLATIFVANLIFGLFYFETPLEVSASFAGVWTLAALVIILAQKLQKSTSVNTMCMNAVLIVSSHAATAMMFFDITTGAAFSFAAIYLLLMLAVGLVYGFVKKAAFG